MSEELRAICVEAISACEDLPPDVKENREAVGPIALHNFDKSYIEFLDDQIALDARGREWNERLKYRRSNLSKYVGRELASCQLKRGTGEYSIEIDPVAGSVVHWEVYDRAE